MEIKPVLLTRQLPASLYGSGIFPIQTPLSEPRPLPDVLLPQLDRVLRVVIKRIFLSRGLETAPEGSRRLERALEGGEGRVPLGRRRREHDALAPLRGWREPASQHRGGPGNQRRGILTGQTCPVSTEGGTRRVQLVREGRGRAPPAPARAGQGGARQTRRRRCRPAHSPAPAARCSHSR